jgi:DNA-binding response OmpR family regulator
VLDRIETDERQAATTNGTLLAPGTGVAALDLRPASGRGASILVVEDDPAVTAMLTDALEARGHSVWAARTASEAVLLADEVHPDLIVLDLVLPDRSGLVTCSDLERRTDASIIICSASQRREDHVLGTRLGACDFLSKPFQLHQLEARVEVALSRRRRGASSGGEPRPDGVQRVGELVLDRSARRVRVAGEPVALTPIEYRLLDALADHLDEALSREWLIGALWGVEDPELASSLAVHARRLRAKLEQFGPFGARLDAVRGFGYRLSPSSGAERRRPSG